MARRAEIRQSNMYARGRRDFIFVLGGVATGQHTDEVLSAIELAHATGIQGINVLA
jgi:hypothetical protein